MSPPVVLVLAGSDSSGAAGVQADLRALAALEVYGATAITAVTAQTSRAVRSVVLDAELVAAQVEAALEELPVAVVKTGMLGVAAHVELAARIARPLVVDPVLRSTSGAPLLDGAGVEALRATLLPRARVVTPNLDELFALTGIRADGAEAMVEAARLLDTPAVVVKGGHLAGDPVDVLVEGRHVRRFSSGPRLDDRVTRGTGCTFASAIAARLARGDALSEAVGFAHRFVRQAIEAAVPVGAGRAPVHALHPWYRWPGEAPVDRAIPDP